MRFFAGGPRFADGYRSSAWTKEGQRAQGFGKHWPINGGTGFYASYKHLFQPLVSFAFVSTRGTFSKGHGCMIRCEKTP